mgnify:CR=1 FL=1
MPGAAGRRLNLITSFGGLVQAAGILCLVVNILRSLKKGEVAGNDPWDAWTLEWTTSSPPPEYNFETDASCAQSPASLGSEAP